MCSISTKEFIHSNLKNIRFAFDDVMKISHKEFLIKVIENCPLTLEVLVRLRDSDNKFLKDEEVMKCLKMKLENHKTHFEINRCRKDIPQNILN